MLNLEPRNRVLDVAAGRGTSALTLAMRFGCEVIGLDYSWRNIEAAKRDASERGLSRTVTFYCGDAERLPFADGLVRRDRLRVRAVHFPEQAICGRGICARAPLGRPGRVERPDPAGDVASRTREPCGLDRLHCRCSAAHGIRGPARGRRSKGHGNRS